MVTHHRSVTISASCFPQAGRAGGLLTGHFLLRLFTGPQRKVSEPCSSVLCLLPHHALLTAKSGAYSVTQLVCRSTRGILLKYSLVQWLWVGQLTGDSSTYVVSEAKSDGSDLTGSERGHTEERKVALWGHGIDKGVVVVVFLVTANLQPHLWK